MSLTPAKTELTVLRTDALVAGYDRASLTPNPSSPFALVLPTLHVSQLEQLQAWLQPNPSSNPAQEQQQDLLLLYFKA